MSLATGSRLGPYEILSLLGAGGMGEVYKARDTRLERTVALKVLPEHLAASPELRQRLEREARTISTLNHPHICVLYDIGHQDGVDYLVMEYLEGETLAQRLSRGALPVQEALSCATQIADALDKAHRQGVIHRDLKPGNVMLTKSGAKLLDFGLAKLREQGSPGGLLSNLPTQATLTTEGTILGTFQYMAPEQIEGKEADARTDVFAFGCTLYEMLTGKKAFEGKSQASLISAIMKDQPASAVTFDPMISPALDRVVRICLAKDADERWQSAHDLTNELKWIAEAGSQAGIPTPVVWRRKKRERLAWTLVLACLVAAVAVSLIHFSEPLPDVRPISFLVSGPEGADIGNVHLSPDGRSVLLELQGRLWIRSLGSLEARPIPGTEGAVQPFWSPDSQFIGFISQGKLKKVSPEGGNLTVICDVSTPRGSTWGSDNTIFFAPQPNDGIWKVAAAGGEPERVTSLDVARGEYTHRDPHALPGGKGVLFTVARSTNYNEAEVAVFSPQTGQSRILVNGYAARYLSSGHLLFARGSVLFAAPFDLEKLEITGQAERVLEGVAGQLSTGSCSYSVSENGALAYIPGEAMRQSRTSLLWVSRRGERRLIDTLDIGALAPLALSPRADRIVTMRFGEEVDLWMYDLERRTFTRITYDPAWEENPVWSPDGEWLLYTGQSQGKYHILRKRSDGSGSDEVLHSSPFIVAVKSISNEGRFAAFVQNNRDIWVLDLKEGNARAFLETPFDEVSPAFSPDGKWLAYLSDDSGRQQLYLQSFPGPGGRLQVSTEGGDSPVWSPDGKELFYRSGSALMVVELSPGPPLKISSPRVFLEDFKFNLHAMAPEGDRFLVTEAADTGPSQPRQAVIVLNWAQAW